MKRFEILGFGLLVYIATLPSCIRVELVSGRSKSPGVHEHDHGESVNLFQADATDPPQSVPSRDPQGVATVQDAAQSESSNSAPATDSEMGWWADDESTDAALIEIQSDETSELLQTSFAGEWQTQVPPAPLPDSENAPPVRAPQPGSLTLDDLEQMALESNPTLQQAAAVVEKARGIREQVGLYPNPTIGYFGQEMGDSHTAGQQGGFVGQTFVTGDKLRLNRAIADWDIEGLSWEYQAQEYRVLNDVRLRYFEVLGAQRRVSIGEDLLRVANSGVKTAEDLFEAKQGARPDVLQARVDLYAVRIILQNARYDYEAAWKQLVSVIGKPELAPVQLIGTLEEDMPQHEWEATYAQLLENSPELRAASARVQRAITQLRRQEVQPIPNLLAQLGAAHDNISGFDEVNVQVGISLPIFNRNQGNIAVAHAEYKRAVRDVERLELALRDRLAVAFRNLQQANQQVERYQKNIIPTAKENLDLTEEGYRQGEFDFLRVLTARRTYFETNLLYVESLIALRKGDVVLSGLLLTGGLNDVRNISPGVIAGAGGLRGMALGGQ